MLLENQHPLNKSILAAMVGAPNAGKSSLINFFLGFDLSIVSRRPQTTRNRINCNFTVDRTEVVLIDTPGIHKSSHEINKRMNGQATEGNDGVDLTLVLVDASAKDIREGLDEVLDVFPYLEEAWLIFTKRDLCGLKAPELETLFKEYQEKNPNLEKMFFVSSENGDGTEELVEALVERAPSGPHLYPSGDVSNKNMRFFAAEYIREQAFHLLGDELPYEIAVVVDEYREYPEKNDLPPLSKISASILVNRPSQRAIVIGAKGSVIKALGANARKKIEAMVGHKVNLNLHVKVSPKWFKNNWVLEEIGLPRVKDSARVWRQTT